MIDPFGVCAEKANSNRVFDGILKTVDGSLWSVFGGVAVSAGLAILATVGAPVTMIAAGLVLTTSGCFSIAYGISDGIEGTQDIYYGATGSTVESINPVRDTVFQGNVEDYWCFRDGAFALRRGECHDKNDTNREMVLIIDLSAITKYNEFRRWIGIGDIKERYQLWVYILIQVMKVLQKIEILRFI